MKNELFKSYRQVIERMNVSGVRPFSETEIQPIYSDIWCEKIIKLLLDKPEKIVPLNPSIIRSMLIMDLIDCNYYNLKLKEKVFNYYHNQLLYFYDSDIFSLYYNRPKDINLKFFADLSYFGNKDQISILLLTKLFQLSYCLFQDIFADNGYEVCGPYYIKNSTFVLHNFSNIIEDEKVQIVLFDVPQINGTIDLFGHSDILFQSPQTVLLVNDEIIYDNQDQLQLLDKYSNKLIASQKLNININDQYINSRLSRYKNIFEPEYLKIVKEEILDRINKNPIYPRITDKNKLVEIISF